MEVNAASRLINILRKAERVSGASKMHSVWSSVFEISESEENKRNIEISRCLGLMHDEIESIKKELNLEELDEFECSDLLDSIIRVLAVHLLDGQWQGFKASLNREIFLCLGYLEQVLPNEEELIDEEDIKEILSILSLLEEQLSNSSLPDRTRNIINKHVENIHTALHSYKIVGVSSIQEALNSVVGEIVANNVVFSEARESDEIGTVKKLLKKMNDISGKVINSEKVVTSSSRLIGHGEKALELIESLL